MSKRRIGFFLTAAALGATAVALTRSKHADTTYPPLDQPKPFANGIWTVDSVMGPGLPIRMTVVQLEDGGLLLHSPTRYSPALRTALEAIGPIRYLVAPNFAHWTFVKDWQDALPDAVTFAAPGLPERRQVRRSGTRFDHLLGDGAPRAWAGQIDHAVVPGAGGFHEVAMYHRASGTLMMTDLVQNLELSKLPLPLRPLAWALGNASPTSRAPTYLRALIIPRWREAAAAARRIVAWTPERIIVTHGRPIEIDAPNRLRHSLAWLTGRARVV